MSDPAYEKLGSFYLGKLYDFDKGDTKEELLLYDAKDLTTHAVCVGMTGSGKTGLCVSLLEEAAIDGIPAIAIDPKGDLGNLMLTFPRLRAEDFEPWVDEGAATRKGMTPAEYAKSTAAMWKKGLGSWQQDGSRIQRLRDAAEVTIYTPGSTAGVPLTVLRSFKAPPEAVRTDADALQERIMASVSGLLALLGVDADPIRSREHILLSNVLHRAWGTGQDLDLGGLIHAIQKPGFERIGVMDLESFYPATERFELAMTLNNLLASPGFQTWLSGEPLDVQRLLWTPAGKPRVSVISIAHLSDAERMFFVTLLLGEVLAWMRSQSGTSSLRALLYMDEVFGFFPPTANPPSKVPLLTLMKQARAFGLGVMLATQNPVDLDYKGLSNAGTWFLGRLQTERDKQRVLDGLEGASAESGAQFDRRSVEKILSGVKSRVFLLNNVHEDAPVLFHTRWAMSYLRGPLTRAQIKLLMDDRKGGAGRIAAATPLGQAPAPAPKAERAPARVKEQRPALPPEITEGFLSPRHEPPAGTSLVYRPALLATARLHFVAVRRDIDQWRDLTVLATLSGRSAPADPWTSAQLYDGEGPYVLDQPRQDAAFAPLPKGATEPKRYSSWQRTLKGWLYRAQALALWRCPKLKAYSHAGESEGDFKVRMTQKWREARDVKMEKLKQKYGSKVARLEERVRKAEQKLEREEAQVAASKQSTWISVGQTILGAILGRKKVSVGTAGRAGTTMRRAGRISKEKDDVRQAKADLEAAAENLEAMEQEFAEESEALKEQFDAEQLEIVAAPIKPRKSDIDAGTVKLVWTPWTVDEMGVATPLFATPEEA